MGSKDLSRRMFLTAAGAATAGALVGCGGAGGAAGLSGGLPPPQSLAEVKGAHFSGLVGETFQVWHPDHGAGEVVLTNFIDRTDEAQVPDGVSGRTPFTLEFEGAEGTVPASDHYEISHPALGEHRLYLLTLPPVEGTGLYDIHLD